MLSVTSFCHACMCLSLSVFIQQFFGGTFVVADGEMYLLQVFQLVYGALDFVRYGHA